MNAKAASEPALPSIKDIHARSGRYPDLTRTDAEANGQPTAVQETQTLPLPGAKALSFEHLSNEHGLSQESVYCILQDRRGFMWFGTENGFNKYEGATFFVTLLVNHKTPTGGPEP